MQVSFKYLHPETRQPKVKKNIVVIGNSVIKNINERKFFRDDSFKI